MNPPRLPRWLIPCIVLTAVLSLVSMSYRYRAEERNRAVDIAVEYETVEAYAAASHKSIEQALSDLKKQGLGSVVLSEEYVGDLVNAGAIQIGPDGIVQDSPRVSRGLSLRFPGQDYIAGSAHPLGGNRLDAGTLRSTSVGLNPEAAATIKKAGLGIVARMANPPGVNADYVRGTLAWAHELGAGIFLPVGDQVLGRRDSVKDMTDELKRLGMLYASPEFSKLGGDDNVLKAAPDLVVRLHSAQAVELDKLRIDEAVERYSLAARERGMRVLLVRPISFAAPSPLASLNDFIRRINLDCRRQGLDMGAARPFKEPGVPTILFLLIGLSIVPTVYFAITVFLKDRRLQLAGLAVASLVAILAIRDHGRPFTALLAAIVYPIVAFLVLDSIKKRNLILDFVNVSLISLVGGLAVAGLLNGLPYLIRAEQFEGVKLAVFLPIAVVALYFAMRGVDLKAALKNPMTWGASILAVVILGGLAFMSMRTGNDNPAGVSDVELKMRFLLDQILMVRPRTKEFMIGHPLLVIGIGLLIEQRKSGNSKLGAWAALALAGGAIGQTDIVNTMCHIHTPLKLSLLRVGVGMVAGCIIGLIAWAVVKRWLPARET